MLYKETLKQPYSKPRAKPKKKRFDAERLLTGSIVLSLITLIIIVTVYILDSPRAIAMTPDIDTGAIELLMPEYEVENEIGGTHIYTGEEVYLDISNSDLGYIMAKCTSARRAILIISKGEDKIVEHLSSDGVERTFPLTFGDGEYSVDIMLNKEGTLYEPVLWQTFDVTITDDMYRFLIPNYLVDYDESSSLIYIAAELRAESANDEELVANTFQWIRDHFRYGEVYLKNLMEGENEFKGYYIPDFDSIINEQKNVICSDLASIYAALLRINGIPCQLIYGMSVQEGGNEVYHAWNLVWVEDEFGNGEWVHYDPTIKARDSLNNYWKMVEVVTYFEPEKIH